jgi:hypothetical protein
VHGGIALLDDRVVVEVRAGTRLVALGDRRVALAREGVVVVGRAAGGGEALMGLLELGGQAAHRGLLAGELGPQRGHLLGADALARRRAGSRRRLRLRLRLRRGLGRAAAGRQRPVGGSGPLAAPAGHLRDGKVDRQARRHRQLGRRELDGGALPREGGRPLLAVVGRPRLVLEHGQHPTLLVAGLHHEHGPDEAMAAQAVPAPAHLEPVGVDPLEALDLEADAVGDDLRSGHASSGHDGLWLPDREVRSTQPPAQGRSASRRRAR